MSITTWHSTMNTTGKTYARSRDINKHALRLITITKSGEVRFSIRFLQMMFHRRFTFCCDEDQTPNITNIQSLKEIGPHLQMSTTTRHSTMNTTGTTCTPSWEINKHALMITITKSGEVWFSIRFFLQMMFRCRFAFCCGEDQSPKHHKHTRFQKRLDYIFKCQ